MRPPFRVRPDHTETLQAAKPKSSPAERALLPRPPLMVRPGWLVEDIKTFEEAAEAKRILEQDIAAIGIQIREVQVAYDKGAGPQSDPEWYIRAHSAWKLKKVAVQRVQEIQGQLRRQAAASKSVSDDRQLLNIVKTHYPDVFANCLKLFSEMKSTALPPAAE